MAKRTVKRTPRGKEVVRLTVRVVSSESNFGENFVFVTGMLGTDAPDILSIDREGDVHRIECEFDEAPKHRLGKPKIAAMLARFLKAGRIARATLSTNEVNIG